MELLSPAGNLQKLHYAWAYGADSAYIGLKHFSLRIKADNFFDDEYKVIKSLKEKYAKQGKPKKLLCALNISFHNADLRALESEIDYFKNYPIDAFIVQDVGVVGLLKKHFPNTALHLSTQANCINVQAVKVYSDMGFSRIVLGREVGLNEVAEIKSAVPEMELECFAHGAMCIAYSGRCLISAYLTGRSANSGFCSHSCRWNYQVVQKDGGAKELLQTEEFGKTLAVEEQERKGEYFPVEEGENYTALFSSKDICMIDYLFEMQKAGVDAIKIEGRMKSLYYTALVTRAYRKKLDLLEGKISEDEARPFIDELYNTAHREFSTGFYFSPDDANKTTVGKSSFSYVMMGTIGKKIAENKFEFISMNKLTAGTPIEFVGPDTHPIEDSNYILKNPETEETRDWVCHGHGCVIITDKPIKEDFIVRVKAVEDNN
ncbi:MAG: peptidase U32 [Treponema sp.]|nr:MAG: peptidase U32 [Treponema sp.]